MLHFIAVFMILFVPALSQAQNLEQEFGADNRVIVEGPIDVRLVYGAHAFVSYDSSKVELRSEDKKLVLTSSLPTTVVLQVPCLEALHVAQGHVFVTIEGNERLTLDTLSAPIIRVRLADRGRFDSTLVQTQHFQIALSDQGKASLKYVDADLFEIEMKDHGDMDVAGLAREQQVELSGYAHYDAEKLESDTVTVALDDFSAGMIQAKNTPTIFASPYTSLSSR